MRLWRCVRARRESPKVLDNGTHRTGGGSECLTAENKRPHPITGSELVMCESGSVIPTRAKSTYSSAIIATSVSLSYSEITLHFFESPVLVKRRVEALVFETCDVYPVQPRLELI